MKGKCRTFLRIPKFVVSLVVCSFLVINLYAQQTKSIAGKIYTQEQGKWFTEYAGKRFEINSRVITVKFKAGITAASKRGFYSRESFTEVRSNALGYIDLQVPEGTNPLDYIQKLQRENLIESAEVNTIGEYVATANDPNFANQWHLVGTSVAGAAQSAWDLTTGSKNIIIGVLDSGTDIGHEDLIGNIWINTAEDIDGDQSIVSANPDHLDNDDKNLVDDGGNGFVDDLCGWDFFNNNNNVRGPFFHGTHVAGIIGAMTNNGAGVSGVAGGFNGTKGCQIMALGVGDSAPDGSILDDAIIYAADNRAHIITLSLTVAPSTAIDAAIDYAYNQKGVFIDCAAGNSGGAVSYPATNTNVVAVSSTDMADVISAFSNRGPEIELAAPGEQIWSTQLNNTYGQSQGTSFSAPQVAGVAGLLLSCDPSLTNNQVRSILHSNSVDLGAPGKDDLYGFGRIDALAALQAIGCGQVTSKERFEYAAKIICGIQKDPKSMRLARGFYATAINIHNPNDFEVKFFKKLSLTYPPEGQKPGRIIPISEDTLKPDEALEVDCDDIQKRLFPNGFPTPYIKGFIVVQTPAKLDVTAVYTTATLTKNGRVKDHSSIDVEQILGKKINGDKPDLVVRDIDLNSLKVDCPGGGGTCVTTVTFTIANVGSGDAGAFNVRVVLDPVQSVVVNVAVSGLNAGETKIMTITSPPGGNCFDPDCTTCIKVDSGNAVDESDETNNDRCETTIG